MDRFHIKNGIIQIIQFVTMFDFWIKIIGSSIVIIHYYYYLFFLHDNAV